MAITCRDIVGRALRKLSRIAAGAEPDGNDLTDAMETLQAIYLEFLALGVFGRLYDVDLTTTPYTAKPQENIRGDNITGESITLPTLVDPVACYVGYGYYDYEFRDYPVSSGSALVPPRDGACIRTTDLFSTVTHTYIYERQTARWIDIEALLPGSTAPISGKYSDGLASILADRIAPEYGMTTPPSVAKAAADAKIAMTHRYDSVRTTINAEYF